MDSVPIFAGDSALTGVSVPVPSSTSRYACFGSVRVDLHTGQLDRNGETTKLPRKCFGILLILLERPNEIVKRDEIGQRLWPADRQIDYAASINTSVNRLRRELGRDVAYIETMTGRGYRFTAHVTFSDSREPFFDRAQVIKVPTTRETDLLKKRFNMLRKPIVVVVATVILAGMAIGSGITALGLYGLLAGYSPVITSILVALLYITFLVRWAARTMRRCFQRPENKEGCKTETRNI